MKTQFFSTFEFAQKTRRASRIVRRRLQNLRDKYNTAAFNEEWLTEQLVFHAMNYAVQHAKQVKDKDSFTGRKMMINRYGAAQSIKEILDITRFCESSILESRKHHTGIRSERRI